jgi:hypothetical protein
MIAAMSTRRRAVIRGTLSVGFLRQQTRSIAKEGRDQQPECPCRLEKGSSVGFLAGKVFSEHGLLQINIYWKSKSAHG